jgi:hypothetical protein
MDWSWELEKHDNHQCCGSSITYDWSNKSNGTGVLEFEYAATLNRWSESSSDFSVTREQNGRGEQRRTYTYCDGGKSEILSTDRLDRKLSETRCSSSESRLKGSESSVQAFAWDEYFGHNNSSAKGDEFKFASCVHEYSWISGPSYCSQDDSYFYLTSSGTESFCEWSDYCHSSEHKHGWSGVPPQHTSTSSCRHEGFYYSIWLPPGEENYGHVIHNPPPTTSSWVGTTPALPEEWLPGSLCPPGPALPGLPEPKVHRRLGGSSGFPNGVLPNGHNGNWSLPSGSGDPCGPGDSGDNPYDPPPPGPELTVQWVANNSPLTANPNGGGLRIFPEQTTSGALLNKVDLYFRIDTIQTTPTTIYYRVLDPVNYITVRDTTDLLFATTVLQENSLLTPKNRPPQN